ncbi:hypothetical protein ACFQE7_34715 [Nonomuraea ferruginea]|uniref:hypothetical protein n=1 Tax=Nonomuraea ferruginea TaxID=46174 RepID=UPI0036243C04
MGIGVVVASWSGTRDGEGGPEQVAGEEDGRGRRVGRAERLRPGRRHGPARLDEQRRGIGGAGAGQVDAEGAGWFGPRQAAEDVAQRRDRERAVDVGHRLGAARPRRGQRHVEYLPEPVGGAERQLLGRVGRHVEHPGELGQVEPADVAEHEHLALLRPQLAQDALDQRGHGVGQRIDDRRRVDDVAPVDLPAGERVQGGPGRILRRAGEDGLQDVGRRAEIAELIGAVDEQPGGVTVVELGDLLATGALIGERVCHVDRFLLIARADAEGEGVRR